MVSYRLVMFGLGIAGVGVVLIFFGTFIDQILDISAGLSTSPEAETSRGIFRSLYDGLALVALVLGGVMVIAGALEDRAKGFR